MNDHQQAARWDAPARVTDEYRQAVHYKSGLGVRGLYEQNRINERFMVGDQWHGARCGTDRPLVRHNIIKRIGDYKMAMVGNDPLSVNYSADGVPNTLELKEQVHRHREVLAHAGLWEQASAEDLSHEEEVNLVMSALSDYFRVTAERVGLEDLKEQVLRDAYVTGTGVLYTYWDERVRTGLYADESRTAPIGGDIACEVVDIEDVYFGDPAITDLQKQPYIILAQRKSVAEIRRLMRAYRRPAADIQQIKPDGERNYQSGDYGFVEQEGSDRTLLLTKLYKEWDEEGRTYTVKAVMVCGDVTVRPVWDIGIRLYPLAAFRWERRKHCAYGESEVTYLVPNQIAINRMITASVWAVMMMGMPIMVVNGDIIRQPVTNEPGQILKVQGSATDVQGAIRYLNPPAFSPAFDTNIASLINNTLTQSGANASALGDVDPDNTSAIIAVREAATLPLQTVRNRFYGFVEEMARIWAEFWVTQYGRRSLKIEETDGTVWYLPFDGRRYRDLLINARVDVGASTLWSEVQSVHTLDNLFDRQIIDVFQYLERLPKGTVPNLNGLLRELQTANAPLTAQEVAGGLDADAKATYDRLPPQQQAALMAGALEQGGVAL